MNALKMHIDIDNNQDFQEINEGSPIYKQRQQNGSQHNQINSRDIDQVYISSSTYAQNQSIGQGNTNLISYQPSQQKKKRSTSLLQQSASSAHTNSSLLQGIHGNDVNNGGNSRNISNCNASLIFDDLYALDKEMLVEKLQIQNSLLKAEKNNFEIELKKKGETVERLEKNIEAIQKKHKNDLEKIEQLEMEQTVLQKKINDIVKIYEINNDNDVNSLKKVSADLRSELNLKQMVIDKQKENIKGLQEQNEILMKNEIEILESQSKTQQMINKVEIVNKNLQKFLKQSTEIQIKLRNQLMMSENNRQIIEEKYNLQSQRANILQSNNNIYNQHNMSMNQDTYGSRTSQMLNNDILRLAKGSNEQSFAFGQLDSVNNNDVSLKRLIQSNAQHSKDEIAMQRLDEKQFNYPQNNHQISTNKEDNQNMKLNQKQNNDMMKNNQQINKQNINLQQQNQLYNNSLNIDGFSKFQNSIQSNLMRKEDLSYQQEIINQHSPSQICQEKQDDIINQPIDSARQDNKQNRVYTQLQSSQRKNTSNNNLMSSLKEHILSISENKENLNEQLQEILKESKRGNDKNVKELMKKFEQRLGQFLAELASQSETLYILQQRLDEQDRLIETYHLQEEENLKNYKETMLQEVKIKYKKQIKLLQKDIKIVQDQKEELLKQFEQQVAESHNQAVKEVSRTYQMQIDDLKSLLDQALVRESQLEQQIKQYKDNSNQKQQRMLQRFKNNSISNTQSQLNQGNLNNNSCNISANDNLLSERNSQIIENCNFSYGNCGELSNRNGSEQTNKICGQAGSKTFRENSMHLLTRDESEYKENRNLSNSHKNQTSQQSLQENQRQYVTSHNTYSPAPTCSINYLSSENHDGGISQFSGGQVQIQASYSKSSGSHHSIILNDSNMQYQQQQHSIQPMNKQSNNNSNQQRKIQEQSIQSSKNYYLSPSSQQNYNEQNSMEFSQASLQNRKVHTENNTCYNKNLKNQYETDNRNSYISYEDESYVQHFYTQGNKQDKNLNQNKHLSSDQLKQYIEDQIPPVQIQRKLYDQFNNENTNSFNVQQQLIQQQSQIQQQTQAQQQVYKKKNIPFNPQSQTLKNNTKISSKSQQVLNSSMQLNNSLQSQHHLQDTFGQKDQGFQQQPKEGQIPQQYYIQSKQNQQGLTRASSYSNLNSSRNQFSLCGGEHSESIHLMRDSKQYNSQQICDFQNKNQNRNSAINYQSQQNSQLNNQIQYDSNQDEHQKSITDFNGLNSFTFTQSQQNHNGYIDVEYNTQQQQFQNNNNIQQQQIQQNKQTLKTRSNCNKLQIVTDTYDEHKLNQMTNIPQKCDVSGLIEVNKSESSKRIRSSSNALNQQQPLNTSSNQIRQSQYTQKQNYQK